MNATSTITRTTLPQSVVNQGFQFAAQDPMAPVGPSSLANRSYQQFMLQ
jgi:hypothetical protein